MAAIRWASHSQALSGIEQIVAYLQGHAGQPYHIIAGGYALALFLGASHDGIASPQELAAKATRPSHCLPGSLIPRPGWRWSRLAWVKGIDPL
jgi:hypothetical protein